ncbi:uncharacterized protein LOC118119669 isoform X1 [Hippoglossus stenolepis]|uniref:uncharacterized protein LOC118119669 isoform X1 n=1 Tax=Hippoglossus stenolepis TaxID=195615 RepID=UPI001FAF7084|nr:uncharacterized protein LOC118119669 isoform X1 [Hippoglossus stenolepis]
MYLENSAQVKVSGEGEPSAEVMLAEQCQVPDLTEAADLTSPLKGSTELGMNVLVEYTEQVVSRVMDSSLLCMEHCRMSGDEAEYSRYCNGHAESFEQYSASSIFFESEQTLDKCETSRLSQPFNECAQHCECFKPCKSSEHSANHSVACNKCCPCCEHWTEHLGLFQQCKPPGQQFESLDFERDKLAIKCDSLGLCEMSDFIAESTEQLELLQQYESPDQQSECSDSEPDTATEDFEQCEVGGCQPNICDSVDSLDCGTELCEYDEMQIEYANGDEEDEEEDEDEDEEESYLCEQNETEVGLSEDVNSSHLNTPVPVCFDDSEHVSFEDAEELSPQTPTLDMSADDCEMCGSEEYETTQPCATSDKTSDGFYTEEDSFSDCSSIETKSFKTCPDGSIPSDPCSDSSGESEKGVQGDSSDEQTQWESFEDDEETEQRHANESDEDETKTPAAVDIVIGDYFDLFDRADHYGHAFAPKHHYISCFDGGDVHEGLNLEKEAARRNAKNAFTYEEASEEMGIQEAGVCPEEACDASQRDDCESEINPEDLIIDSESSFAEYDEVQEEESEACELYTEYHEEAEEDEDTFDRETAEGHVSEICNEDEEEEEEEICLSSGHEESMSAPCAENISVEGDAYEEEVFESLGDSASSIDLCRKDDESEPDDKAAIECPEMEPYWWLIDNEGDEEACEPGVEDYYAYQIQSAQSSVKQALKGLITESPAPGVCPAESEAVGLAVSEDIEPSENLASCSAAEETANKIILKSDKDISTGTRYPLDIIHSVVPEHAKLEGGDAQTEENDCGQGRDSDSEEEEEESDDESSEACDCDYCIPPTEQVPGKPLLPRIQSNDAGKICVVIDLDETLVHSSFKPVNNADFIIPVEIDGTVHQVYVLKRPHVDEFLKRMGELFECVLFTASLAKYADPVSDLLDKWGAFRSRLFRESCVFHKGNYVKDLSRLGRDLNKVIIIDNSPASYVFHPENAVPVVSWFDDMSDTELLDLIPFFERLSTVDDVYDILKQERTSS